MKTNKTETVPRLRFPEFQGDWEKKNLGSVADLICGYAFKGEDISKKSEGIPLLRGINITEGFIRHSNEIDRYYLEGYEGLEKYLLKKDDIVISMDGSKVGKNSALIDERDAGSLLIQRVARLRLKEVITTKFIFHQINSTIFQNYVDTVNTSSGIPHISAKQIDEFFLKFPKIEEQKKIADCLSSLDDLINAENEQLDALQEYKAGLLQQLFPAEGETTPKLRFAEFEGDGDWEEVKLVDVAETSIGLVTTMTTSYVEKGIPLIRNSDIKPNAIRMTKLINLSKEFADKYENKKLLKNDIVTVHTGDIGVSAIVEQDLEGSLGFATLNTRVTSSNVSPEFVCWFFNSPEYKRFALSMATGDGRNNFNLRDFNKTILFIPDILEQQKVVDCLSSLDNLIQAKDKQIDALKDYKQGLMQQLFPTQNM